MKKKYIFPAIVIGSVVVYYAFIKKKDEGSPSPGILPGEYYPDTTTVPKPPPVKEYTQTTPTPVQAANVREQYLRSLKTVITDAQHLAVFNQMTEPELYYSWWYVANYLQTGKKLLSHTKMLPDGSWDNSNPGNQELFDAITSIHNKYGIF